MLTCIALLCSLPSAFICSGFCSAVERIVLASVQLRQSPTQTPLFGFATLVLDGVKLFAKVLPELSLRMAMSSFIALCLLVHAIAIDELISADLALRCAGVSKILCMMCCSPNYVVWVL
jgi:NADH:ubiquinone oxidoreductase subunit H